MHIKERDVLAASRAAAELPSTDVITVKPEIDNNSDAQDKADWHNVFCLAAIGVKEGITEGITKIVGREIDNPILRTTDNTDFKSVDQYQKHQLFTTIKERAEQPDSSNVRQQFVNIAGKFFDWTETVVTNVKRMAAMADKFLGYGVRVHTDLRALVILANKEWAAQQTWGLEISVSHYKIVSKVLVQSCPRCGHNPQKIANTRHGGRHTIPK